MKQVITFAVAFWTVTIVLAAALYDPNQMRATHQIQMVPAAPGGAAKTVEIQEDES